MSTSVDLMKTAPNNIVLWHGDCLEKMKLIPDESVDLVLCDLPYGVTKCKWDSVIDIDCLPESMGLIEGNMVINSPDLPAGISVSLSAIGSEGDILNGVDSVFIVDCTNNCGLETTIEVYAKKIYEKYLLRLVVSHAKDIEKNAMDNKVDALDTLVAAHTSIGELINLRPDSNFDINDALGDAIESIQNTDKLLIQTGFENVDKFAGGLTRGEITIIGGRPGHGKSTMMLNMLSNVLTKKKKVLLFNRELTNVEVLKKLIALESGKLSYGMIRKGIYEMEHLQELDRIRGFIAKKYSPNKFRMYDAYPNPFNPLTQIRYEIPTEGFLEISIFDLRGQKVETLVNEFIQPGEYSSNWNASQVSSGVYFVQLTASSEGRASISQIQKLMLIK